MKARDIIPGWPRGKSTSGHSAAYLWPHLLWLTPYDLQAIAYRRQFEEEEEANRCYHAGQQAMVDRFRQGGWHLVL